MRTHAQAVVIGGGLIGCSILYHLAKYGWSDVVLLERDELTSGSTWHAAANIHGLHDSTNISRLQHYTMALYKELETETGQGCGIFQPGSLYLAQTEAREHQLRLQEAKARRYKMNFYEVGRDEAERLHPLVNFDGIRCIMYEPEGGNVDPSGVTAAYAAGARQRGAEIHRFTPVAGTEAQPDGSWIVRTPKGDIRTQWVVNAAGLWGREVAAMAGLHLPLIPTEHQYFVTEAIPEIAAMGRRLPSVADRDGEYYLRQEGLGLLIGAYERNMKFWAEDATPLDFGHELFPDDLDRIEDNMMRAIARVPAVGTAGVKRVINGPMIWSPDSAVLFGPVPELQNYFCCNGIIPGFSQSGGMGKLAAEWMIEGEPSLDMFAWDMARFGHWAGKAFTKARVQDQYSHRFKIHFPNEERAAGRPVRTRPAYEMQKQMGAVFGLNFGWEHPLWFAAEGEPREETIGFKRQNWWGPVGREARMLREHAGIIDVSNFAKYEVKGPGAEAWLNALFANRMPTRDRALLSHAADRQARRHCRRLHGDKTYRRRVHGVRFRHGRTLPSKVLQSCPVARGHDVPISHRRIVRLQCRGSEVARIAAAAHQCRFVDAGVSVHALRAGSQSPASTWWRCGSRLPAISAGSSIALLSTRSNSTARCSRPAAKSAPGRSARAR